jgi:hypothetical protein
MPAWDCVTLRAAARVGIRVHAPARRGGGERKSPSRARGRKGLKPLVWLGRQAFVPMRGPSYAEASTRLREAT